MKCNVQLTKVLNEITKNILGKICIKLENYQNMFCSNQPKLNLRKSKNKIENHLLLETKNNELVMMMIMK